MNVPFKKQLKNLLLLGIMLFSVAATYAQQGTIKGTVSDANGDPIIGATVFIEGTTQGTVTDVDGAFTLPNMPVGSVNLAVNFVGYLKETQTVTVTAGETSQVSFSMIEDLQQLSEVVVIGYGTVKKQDLTGAVSSVKTEELTKLATTNVQQAIQGRVAGVMVTANSGAPGDDINVRIRGISTINNSDPLYVVDGFPSNSISYLNPSDIESMEVLKDASATAIYGNRGSNGVILITTKKGKDQKSTISFNMYYGSIIPNKPIPVCNAQEYVEAKFEAYRNFIALTGYDTITKGTPAIFDTLYWASENNIEGTDWQKQVLHNGTVQNYELNMSGGNDKYTFSASGSYNREDGVVINSWQKKYNLRYAGQAQLNKMIKSSFSIAYRNYDRINYNTDLFQQGILPNAIVGDPISPIYRSDTAWWGPVDISQTWNPVAAADRARNNKNKGDQAVGNFGVDIEPIKGLVISSKVGGDLNWTRTQTYLGVYHIGAKDYNDPSSLNESYQRSFGWNNSNYINYSKTFNKNSINIMIGQEWSAYDFRRLRYIIYDIPEDPALWYPDMSTGASGTPPAFNSDVSNYNRKAYDTKLFSYFGRLIYNYNDMFLFTGNMRRDGSSQIAEENRWGNFPSLSVGINIKNIALKDMSAISALKLRYGWGKTGNIGSVYDPYGLYPSISYNWNMIGENGEALTGAIQTVNPNRELQWEEVVQSNYAVDFGLLNNKLTGTVDFYTKTTTGMIVTIQPPVFAGSQASAGNYGEMKSKGCEIDLNYRNNDHELKYEIGGNFTWLSHPMVTKWGNPWYTGRATKINNVIRTMQDEEMGHFYGYKTDGLITAADTSLPEYSGNPTFYLGQIKILDLNHDSIIDIDDKTNIGSPNPDFFYGINLTLSYKGIDLVMFFQGVYGNELINGMNVWSLFPDEGDNNLNREVLDSWTPENPNSSIPRLVQGNMIMQQYFNDYIVEDASYFRLKNLQLGYTLPSSITSKAGISNLRIYVSADNLFTLTKYSGYDPEVGSAQYSATLQRNDPMAAGIDQASYPVGKKYLFGVNVTF
jgi:TonB-dependent starch-binding outer membrane protein SusC